MVRPHTERRQRAGPAASSLDAAHGPAAFSGTAWDKTRFTVGSWTWAGSAHQGDDRQPWDKRALPQGLLDGTSLLGPAPPPALPVTFLFHLGPSSAWAALLSLLIPRRPGASGPPSPPSTLGPSPLTPKCGKGGILGSRRSAPKAPSSCAEQAHGEALGETTAAQTSAVDPQPPRVSKCPGENKLPLLKSPGLWSRLGGGTLSLTSTCCEAQSPE